RPARQDDGACRGDHLRVVRNRVGKTEGARGARDPGRHDADRDRSARGRAHHLTHGELVDVVRGTSCTTTARDDARAVAWWVLLGAGSGAIAGALVGGVGGRLAMLLLRITSPDLVVGMTSDDGFEIGVVSGAAAALVVVLVERGSRVEPWADRRLSAGLCAAALAGSFALIFAAAVAIAALGIRRVGASGVLRRVAAVVVATGLVVVTLVAGWELVSESTRIVR